MQLLLYYKIRQLLQNATILLQNPTVTTKCDIYYKLQQTKTLQIKTDFDEQLTSFNRKITSNKAKYLEVQKKVNSLIRNDYNFFLGRIYFTSDKESQNTFVYQLTPDTLE